MITILTRKVIILVFISFLFILTHAQKTYTDGGVKYVMPDTAWSLTHKQQIAPRMHASFYKRIGILSPDGLRIASNIAVITEELVKPGVNVLIYSIDHVNSKRYDHIDLKIAREFRVKTGDRVIYRGTYNDPKGKEHIVYVVFVMNGNKGLHFIADVNTEIFDQVEDEVKAFIKSIEVQD